MLAGKPKKNPRRRPGMVAAGNKKQKDAATAPVEGNSSTRALLSKRRQHHTDKFSSSPLFSLQYQLPFFHPPRPKSSGPRTTGRWGWMEMDGIKGGLGCVGQAGTRFVLHFTCETWVPLAACVRR